MIPLTLVRSTITDIQSSKIKVRRCCLVSRLLTRLVTQLVRWLVSRLVSWLAHVNRACRRCPEISRNCNVINIFKILARQVGRQLSLMLRLRKHSHISSNPVTGTRALP